AAPSLSASLTIPGSTYTARQTVSMTATVLNGAVAASGASVTFTMTEANGAKLTKTATTDSTGKAVWSYKIDPKDPKGTWAVVASASYSSQTKTSNVVNFTVQ